MCSERAGRTVEVSERHSMKGKTMHTTHRVSRPASIAIAALLMAVTVPAPANARPDPGTLEDAVTVVTNHHCKQTRIGTQFVRCDALTGAGSAAPSWIPES